MSDPVDQLENRMSWPTTPQPPNPRRPRRRQPRPKPPPLTLRQRQRQIRKRVIMRITVVTIISLVLPLTLAVVVVVAIGRSDRPADVPPDFRPPTELPRAAARLPLGHILFSSDRNGTYGIYAMRNDGQNVRPIVEDPTYDSWGVRLSPDGLTAVFYRTPANAANRDPAAASLWAVASDGSSPPVLVRPAGLDGWVVQSHAEWDVHSSYFVMAGGERGRPKLYVTNNLGQNPTGQPLAVTAPAGDEPRDRYNPEGPHADPSYSPDGRDIYFVACPGDPCELQDRELYRVPAGGGEAVRLTFDRRRDREPYVSPLGDKVAWLTFEGAQAGDGWQLRIADVVDGRLSSPRSLLAFAGEDVVGRPQWSLDGGTIYVHRKASGRATTGIFAISTNTTDPPRELTLGQAGNHEDPSL